MNFLAHLHLASLADSDLLGNLLADFVRGDPFTQFSTPVAEGIMLHRRIDVLTDQSDYVQQAKRLFSSEVRRVAPITLDVLWDHFLARHWGTYSPKIDLPQFVNFAEQTIKPALILPNMPESFLLANRYMWSENWLINYADIDYIEDVLKRMARRRPKLGQLAASFADIQTHYAALEAIFAALYPELMAKSRNLK